MIQISENAGFVAADQFLATLVDVSAKSALIVFLAFIFSFAIKRLSSSSRSLVWLLAVGAIASLPVLAVIYSPSPANYPLSAPTIRQAAPQAQYPGGGLTVLAHIADAAKPESRSAKESGPDYCSLISQAAITTSVPNQAARAVILLWLVGALLFALHFASSLFALGRVYRSAAFIRGGREFALIEKCREAIGTRANVTLAFAGPDSRITMPITWGYLQPVIVLPISAKEWDDGHLTAAFLHELAHIRRRDWLQQLLGLAVCCVYWFNPLVWAAVGNLREECEAASDDIVIRSGMKPAEYARHLLETAKSAGDNPRYAIAMVRKRRLENRLRYLPRTTRIALRHTLSGPLQCVRPRS